MDFRVPSRANVLGTFVNFYDGLRVLRISLQATSTRADSSRALAPDFTGKSDAIWSDTKIYTNQYSFMYAVKITVWPRSTYIIHNWHNIIYRIIFNHILDKNNEFLHITAWLLFRFGTLLSGKFNQWSTEFDSIWDIISESRVWSMHCISSILYSPFSPTVWQCSC